MGLDLSKLKEVLSKIFHGNSSSFLGVDIGSSSIKVVQLKKRNGVVVLETYGELSLGPYAKIESGRSTNLNETEISEALGNLLKEANVTTKECGISIPLRSSLVFVMEMPFLDKQQLAQMVPIEARKYIPVSISDVQLDWKIIPKKRKNNSEFVEKKDESKKEKEKEKIEVLVVAIHKNSISEKTSIAKNLNLNLNFLEIEIFSTIRSVVGQNNSDFAVLDMGSGSSKLYIVGRGIVKESHIIARGSQDFTLNISSSMGISIEEAEEKKIKTGILKDGDSSNKEVSKVISNNLDYIFGEVNKNISNYQKKNHKSITNLIITGGGSVLEGISDFSKLHLNMDVEIADPFSKVDTPPFLDDLLKKVGPEFSVALGLALRGLSEKD